jgi:hypothetical protein
MLIKKILQTFVDIVDPNDIYSSKRDEMLLDKLRAKFVGKCYNSCCVMTVNKIIRRSYLHMKDTLNGDAQLSVMFEVDAIVYMMHEIINGCEIIKKEPNGIIHAKSNHAGIQLNIHQNMSIFKEGDVLPVIVKKVRYNINQTDISILAMPFIPMDYDVIYYKITGLPSETELTSINNLIKQIKDEEGKISKLNTNDKKIYKFFVDLLNNQKKIPEPKKAKKINISDLNTAKNISNGTLFKLENRCDDPFVYFIEDDEEESLLSSIASTSVASSPGNNLSEKTPGNNLSEKTPGNNLSEKTIINESPFNAISQFLIQYLCNLQTLQDFIRAYPSFASVQTNKSIWKMYSMLKK